MAHESFEDADTADLINKYFVPIKVDREERPDIDSIYMSVCQALTGSGGWPTSIFMTPQQKPFFAGTYFPPTARRGSIGLRELLAVIHEKWEAERDVLLGAANEIVELLDHDGREQGNADMGLIEYAVTLYKQSYDQEYGGFGSAPKFPAPHNLLFLMSYYEKSGDKACLEMAENTLLQMYRGGLFDHIGGGFCRYSTDRHFLAPHFEKMLYDNALLIMAYCQAYQVTQKPLYLKIAEKTASYILREMTSPEGGFYSAQDADSDGEEGKYYVFEPSEIIAILGEEAGQSFNHCFDITAKGNFNGKNIPNLLKHHPPRDDYDRYLPEVYAYRLHRNRLHLDDKFLTAWNALMITAMCHLYRISHNQSFLDTAQKAQRFIEERLCEEDSLLVSFRDGKRGGRAFLDDYAHYTSALLALHQATFDKVYLERALHFCQKAIAEFHDPDGGGFYLYGQANEQLILRPKETHDGALPSGNSVMAGVLLRLFYLTDDDGFETAAKHQLDFLAAAARSYPPAYANFLLALADYLHPPIKITAVAANRAELQEVPFTVPLSSGVRVLNAPTEEYPLKDGKSTFYVCRDRSCQPPVNRWEDAFRPPAFDRDLSPL